MAMNREKIALKYDAHADVLYVLLGSPVPAETDEDDNGLLLRYAISDGHPCGVTILDFKRDHWDQRVPELSSAVASHFHVSAALIQNELSSAPTS